MDKSKNKRMDITMKKSILLLVLATLLIFSACDILSTSYNQDEVYEKLSSLAANPAGKTDLTGSITFTVYIASEPTEQTFGDDTIYLYQAVYISRSDDVIYLDVTGIDTKLPEDSYATVTGKVNGSISWTEDNKKVEVLDVKATKMEAFTPSEEDPNTENYLQLKSGTYAGNYEFVGAHFSKTSFDDVIVLYFNFTNTAPDSNVKFNGSGSLLSKNAMFYHGDTIIKKSSFDPKDLNPAALEANDMHAYTYSGNTQLYYTTFYVDEAAAGTPLYVDIYNDNFEWTHSIEVPIADSLAALQG